MTHYKVYKEDCFCTGCCCQGIKDNIEKNPPDINGVMTLIFRIDNALMRLKDESFYHRNEADLPKIKENFNRLKLVENLLDPLKKDDIMAILESVEYVNEILARHRRTKEQKESYAKGRQTKVPARYEVKRHEQKLESIRKELQDDSQ